MEAKIFSRKQIPEAVELLRKGELVAFPAETAYGFDALATNEKAAKGVYAAKGCPSDNPLIVTVSDKKMMGNYVNEVSERAKKLIKHFRPGPLTIILLVKEGTLPDAVTGRFPTVAFRCPDDELIHDLINELGKPIVGPSADTSTKPSPTTAGHVHHDLKGKTAGIIDNRPTGIGLEPIIIDLSVEAPTVLRPEEITPEEVSRVLGKEILMNKGTTQIKGVPKAPGMKYRHRAPSAPVFIVDKEEDFSRIRWDKETGVAVLDEVLDRIDSSNEYSLGTTINKATRNLFGALRYSDSENNIKRICVQGFDHGTISPAYTNRLNKAAAGYHFH